MTERNFHQVRREIRLMRQICYKGTVKILGSFEDSSAIYIVQEICAKVRCRRRERAVARTLACLFAYTGTLQPGCVRCTHRLPSSSLVIWQVRRQGSALPNSWRLPAPSSAQGDLFKKLIRSGGVLEEKYVAAEVILPLLTTLQHLHARKIYHRDIK
jgi:serine/threonine protein kinase